ncbi:P-loop containing nucleoside triphosphate hydrolase protein [Mycena albidolilacea]|uniref:P-loop containing nucleoside triphosphate hydrolase protein n=1 Tax=Mycena albidolilacea TaxID=1033008 RepID=A0AAD6ZZW9_9AGAR|nr:P-loop containing nucleoside triphosphate hydrolase protein [Mycena albidolilacea]
MAESTGPGLGGELVSIINKLQDAFALVGTNAASQIDLPQICVLGSQSSGKSSVLENIVGRDFLPRGQGIVTRRPLVLQLIHRPSTTSSTGGTEHTDSEVDDKSAIQDEWGEFLHLPGRKFSDFGEIRNEIVRDTEAKTGCNAGISPQPINLRIYSPNVLTLTLVDLPGLTKFPVGDQPPDIEKQIRNMLMTYISQPSCIILAVTPANQDLANSEGLKMARNVDPEGLRTIGVLTKVDLMDIGTDVLDILRNRIIPLRLGYVPVVNRGQKDIDSSRAISFALQKERDHIRNTLPSIKASISQRHQRLSVELQALGRPLAATNSANVLSTVITDFATEFRTVINGTNTAALSLDQLSGGARIAFVFHELFSTAIKNLDPFNEIKDADIRTILFSTAAIAAFPFLVKHQINRLERPSLKCCELVYDELLRIIAEILAKMASALSSHGYLSLIEITQPAFKRYPALRDRVNSVALGLLKKSIEPTKKLVSDMIAMQTCYISTAHPDFIGGHKVSTLCYASPIAQERIDGAQTGPGSKTTKVAAAQGNNSRDLDVEAKKEETGYFSSFFSSKVKVNNSTSSSGARPTMEAPPATLSSQSAFSSRETLEVLTTRLLISSYFNIVKREMIDTVPKAISLNLILHTTKNMQQELLQALYKPGAIDELLIENEDVVTRRRELTAMVEALNKAEECAISINSIIALRL